MATAKSVDASLWWDPFSSLLAELEDAPLSADLPPPLVKKLEENRGWFLGTVLLFRPPNAKSKEALASSQQQLKIGPHELTVKPESRDKALAVSSFLGLDEVQSYILVERSMERPNAADDLWVQEFPHAILLQYYIERQCLLKCTRRILTHALCIKASSGESNVIREEAVELISIGLESKSLSALDTLLSSSHPEQMDVDLFTLWAEETLTEVNLILDILFLMYYESFCTCNGERWRKLCTLFKDTLSGSYNFEKLAVSAEAVHSSHHAKVQLLLILIETLDLESVLQMVHDGTPLRRGTFVFSLTDIQEMDALVSSFSSLAMKEAGSLFLTWAVFLRLIASLPGNENDNVLKDIDDVGYVRQAFGAASLEYFLEILLNDILKNFDGPVAGYRSVLRTFISAFIASYEINNQLEDSTLSLILEILCKIYRGEESLCMQFWDRGSFIDGPIRCLLCTVEGDFPFRTMELVRLLSSLCEGHWPAECVFNFLDKSVGISSSFEIDDHSLVDETSQTVETHLPLQVPGIEGLLIPAKTRGHVLRVIGGNTALVRWEYRQSGISVLLLHLAQRLYGECTEEIIHILDLLNRMVSFNMGLCFTLMNIRNTSYVQSTMTNAVTEYNIWVVEVISSLIRHLYPSSSNAATICMGVNFLAKMIESSPSSVAVVALKADMFDVSSSRSSFDGDYNGSSRSWLLSGRLAKMLFVDYEQNDYDCSLTVSVLEFTMKLVESGLENDAVLALLVFSLQYILVNHEFGKYKAKHLRWKVTIKVLELTRTCIMSLSYFTKFGEAVWDLLLSDSSIHSMLFRVACTTAQALENLYVNRLFELSDIEELQLAILSALDILSMMLSRSLKALSTSLPVFHQAVLSSTTKPIPVTAAVMSLISYFRNSGIQIAAARLLSMIFMVADYVKPMISGIACFSVDDKQMIELRHAINCILQEKAHRNEDLFLAIVNLLTSAARFQPAFLLSIFSAKEHSPESVEQSTNDISSQTRFRKSSLLHLLLQHVEKSSELIQSNPQIALAFLNFLKALWEAAAHYKDLLDWLKRSQDFWKHLSGFISLAGMEAHLPRKLAGRECQSLANKYQCQSAILEIMACDMFLQKKLSHAKLRMIQLDSAKVNDGNAVTAEKSKVSDPQDPTSVVSTWCQGSVLDSLVKTYASCGYDGEIWFRLKVAASLFAVHVMARLAAGDTGSLSISLIDKFRLVYKQMSSQPPFSELLALYGKHGYSEGKELQTLILNDLYYQIQGEFEGRKISPGPFKELFLHLVESNFLQSYRQEQGGSFAAYTSRIYLYNVERIQADIRLDLWNYTSWSASKAIAETMVQCIEDANSMLLFSSSKLSALKALITLLSMHDNESGEKKATSGSMISEKLISSCVSHISNCIHSTLEKLAPTMEASADIFEFLASQAELVIYLIRKVQTKLSVPVCLLVLRTCVPAIKVLKDTRPAATRFKTVINFSLLVLVSVVEFSHCCSGVDSMGNTEFVEEGAEFSNLCLGHLPVLCDCLTMPELCTVSLTTADLILGTILMPTSWFPVIKEHLQLQHIVRMLQAKNSPVSSCILLKFFLTLARVRGGAELLLNAGFFSSLRVLFSYIEDGRRSSATNRVRDVSDTSDKNEESQHLWGLGLAVVTAMVHSLGDSSSIDIVNNEVPYFFFEKADLIAYYLSAPDFPSDDPDRKRARAQRRQTSLTALKETEHTLMLMCILLKQWNSWTKAMKEMDSHFRERSIHLLAFISRGTQRLGESFSRNAPLPCPPIETIEFEFCKKPSFVNSKNGWFALAPLGCVFKSNFSAVSTALIVKDRAAENLETISATRFSDNVALQIYRVAFLLLKFLCLQAQGAAKRAEEVGFVDLAHFPELPMPEILHGLQDQALSIIAELGNASKTRQMHPEIQSVCELLLQILEMALYLELCVLHICGIRPVLGRVEDFSKELKSFVRVVEEHAFLKASLNSLKQVIALVYPGLLQAEGLL
ncbi:uncharacterized protein LOC115672831 isoform X2 [Syzygium oleosum]|uniref:uncharacterized protein LOC115672831 isoform X2 n=1 Tax=Syzygium oleosum TaxID=219896 RepID=UPI0024B9740E|nr:uncharacterized protein LOC115672831 isoform X2 [Syzygium oleosum]